MNKIYLSAAVVGGLVVGWFAATTFAPTLSAMRNANQIIGKVVSADCREAAADTIKRVDDAVHLKEKAVDLKEKAGSAFGTLKAKLLNDDGETQ